MSKLLKAVIAWVAYSPRAKDPKYYRDDSLLWFVGILLMVLGFLFGQSLVYENILFSNDGPLGGISSDASKDAYNMGWFIALFVRVGMAILFCLGVLAYFRHYRYRLKPEYDYLQRPVP